MKLLTLAVFITDALINSTPSLALEAAFDPNPYAYRVKTDGRVVAIGDLHGDLEATRKALRLAGAIDSEDHWVGENLVVVQTGDQIDREDDDREILDLLHRLAVDAVQHHSHLIILNGNHEFLNVRSDMRYVTLGAFQKFQNLKISQPSTALPQIQLSEGDKYGLPGMIVHKEDPGVFERVFAFAPGGHYAHLLAKRSLYAVVNDSVFVHGGILPSHIEYGLNRINQLAQSWLLGHEKVAPKKVVSQSTSPVWVRTYSDPHDQEASSKVCQTLKSVLKDLEVKRMVVGHTIQKKGINSTCKQRLWRIDVALSKGFLRYKGHPVQGKFQILEIQGDEARILTAE